ncbi:hypothetical protein AWE51_03660 [Aquimarina aggregata]|uniref:Carboxypeptidase-like regulatory domain-containing protein n=1 Tax=Aquimarina aggregata TaxID=1642818 RepID=A0A163CLW7_9FLAO|nr:hypothetical protein [Aquimarina aggregata]KZS42550.1 hypothetical protein AWE51_03660 [Aquimarina aggregata]
MKKLFALLLLFLSQFIYSQAYSILDAANKTPVSYATISFGNGSGTFADADGRFKYYKKWYPKVDSLYVSALGYKEITISTNAIPKTILLEQNIAELKEVYITAEKKRKYKTKRLASTVHNDYFRCWLPTVESEIAVFFPKESEKSTSISSVFLPVKVESSNKHSGKEQPFSTLFKMQFYANEKGFPGKRLAYEDIIFKITEKDKSNFELNVSEYKVYIPKEGIFISVQVLGYADKNGKLQQTRKYHEVETRKGLVKVSTTFRPLLPFTNKFDHYHTFTRRIFYKNRTWQRFDRKYSTNNNLIKSNNTNYGMGLKLRLYEDK